MTQADTVPAVRMSLDHLPTQGHGQVADVDATTPLPDGWGSFCSKPGPRDADTGRWYATAPWHVDKIKMQAPPEDHVLVAKLEQTVYAHTWVELHAKVAHQVALFNAFVNGEAL